MAITATKMVNGFLTLNSDILHFLTCPFRAENIYITLSYPTNFINANLVNVLKTEIKKEAAEAASFEEVQIRDYFFSGSRVRTRLVQPIRPMTLGRTIR